MTRMPVLFIGHGSPMNAIEENSFVEVWRSLATRLPKPSAILSVSAHWYTEGIRVADSATPKTIYDMYGFPKELYEIVYDAPGAPEFAHMAKNLIERDVTIDNSWGLDHGTWSVLHRMYPKADIPVFQLSVDRNASIEEHYAIGKELSVMREKGVLLLGSGNVVHNLSRISWGMDGGYAWANEFDEYIKEAVLARRDDDIINYQRTGESAFHAFKTPDHFAPLLYVLGASDRQDKITVLNDSRVLGSLSMTSYLFE